VPTGDRQAESWLLGLLLLEPQRWHDVQREVMPADFQDEPRRRLAELLWAHQRDEGEPVLSEFLGSLPDDLKGLAVEVMDEVEELLREKIAVGTAKPLATSVSNSDTLRSALGYLIERKLRLEKLSVENRRRNDGLNNGPDEISVNEISVLVRASESARQPNMRRGV
jgi:replicative DNA helicase